MLDRTKLQEFSWIVESSGVKGQLLNISLSVSNDDGSGHNR